MSETDFQRRLLFFLILIAGLAWIGISADPSQAGAARSSSLVKGGPAPDFTLMTPQGEPITLADLRGHAVLINLWATWCPPCRQEMPTIQKVYDEYRDEGFTVLAVNVSAQDDALAIMPFVEKYNLTFPILLDETGIVGRTYGLRSLPTSYFVGRDGTIHEIVIGGPMPEALLRARVEELLR